MPPDPERRTELLTAALRVFLRYGWKKTSMDEVARAAGLSRPGLYLHFATKEELFRATCGFLVDKLLDAARAALSADRPLTDRLVDAFLACHGSALEHGEHVDELFEAAEAIGGDVVPAWERSFRGALADAIGTTRTRAGLPPAELAEVLDLVSQGIKHRSPGRYREEIGRVVAILVG
jgi:AcrR family transcriptional regulator